MRSQASVLHLDLDAFFAAVEQRDKPSLRGKPVVVGGVGGRGVVATASYEARVHGVRSAMSTREARSRCPHAAFLSGRFHAYREASRVVMGLLREVSPLVEPLSLDEAFVDLERADLPDLEVPTVTDFAQDLRRRVHEATGGLTASVGLATSKFVAKIASDLDKPDGLVVVAAGHRAGAAAPDAGHDHPRRRPGDRRAAAPGRDLHRRRPRGRPASTSWCGCWAVPTVAGCTSSRAAATTASVVAEREAKSVSVEGTYDTDLSDLRLMEGLLARQAGEVAARLRAAGLSGRTVSIKVRLHDFTTLSRSTTLASPTDHGPTVARSARALLADLVAGPDTGPQVRAGVRLLGVGVSGLADWVQEDLFADTETDDETDDEELPEPPRARHLGTWAPGMDVVHAELGRGWVWGAGRGVVTVRFETRETPAGPVRSFPDDDPALAPWSPAEPEGDDPVSGPA